MTALKQIAVLHCDFKSKFGIPRQSNMVPEIEGTIVFEPEYRAPEALRGLEDFSYIWLIWGFSKAERDTWSPTVRPPRLGGNTRMGVFATRSPFRPNALGLSSVEIGGIEQHPTQGPIIHVKGADLMDGTPIYDIKPYVPYVDSHPDAKGGFASHAPRAVLKIEDEEDLLGQLPPESGEALRKVLAHDPRPSYQEDPERVYGMEYAGFEVKFSVVGDVVKVQKVEKQ